MVTNCSSHGLDDFRLQHWMEYEDTETQHAYLSLSHTHTHYWASVTSNYDL